MKWLPMGPLIGALHDLGEASQRPDWAIRGVTAPSDSDAAWWWWIPQDCKRPMRNTVVEGQDGEAHLDAELTSCISLIGIHDDATH